MPKEQQESHSRLQSRSPQRGLHSDHLHGGTRSYHEEHSKHGHRRHRSKSPSARSDRSLSGVREYRRHRDSPSTSRSHSRERSRKERSRSPSRRKRERSLSSSSSDDGRHRRDDRRSREKEREKRRRSKERRRAKKKEKKEKKKKRSIAGNVPHWGKYGIISDLDIFKKSQEFHTWLVEERKINPETISKEQSKKEFAHFVEDYNTATLPHEKYYNMEIYERRMSALRQGEYLPPPDDSYDPNADMKALAGAHKKKRTELDSYMSKDQLMALRKVQHERVEAGKMRLLGMEVSQTMGVRMDGTMFDD